MVITEEVQNAVLNAAAALVNSGNMLFREGTTTLVTFNLKATAFVAAVGGQAQLDVGSPTMAASVTADATVALDNYQIRTSGGAVRFSGDVGAVGSGAEFELNHPDVEEDDLVTVAEFTLSMPTGA